MRCASVQYTSRPAAESIGGAPSAARPSISDHGRTREVGQLVILHSSAPTVPWRGTAFPAPEKERKASDVLQLSESWLLFGNYDDAVVRWQRDESGFNSTAATVC